MWTPKWEEMQKLYATAERVEDINEGSGEDLERLKTLQRFSGPTLTRLARCIEHHTCLNGIRKEFDDGTVRVRDMADQTQIAEVFQDAGVSEPEYPYKFTLSERWKYIRDHLQELNQDDYQHIVDIIEVLVHRNRHVDEEERRRTIIEALNKVLTYENMEIGLDGKVQVIGDDGDE